MGNDSMYKGEGGDAQAFNAGAEPRPRVDEYTAVDAELAHHDWSWI